MKQKMLVSGWYVDFKCMGAPCPLTCCTTSWDIRLTEDEIRKYQSMENAFQPQIMKAIDVEAKKFRGTAARRCQMLTEEGWCQIVQNCGEEALCATCQSFPRTYRWYGDILEASVELVCPGVAAYCFSDAVPQYELIEIETECDSEDYDYNLYDSLSVARGFLIDLIGEPDIQFLHGKIYIMLKMVEKISELLSKGEFSPKDISEICAAYSDGQEVYLKQLEAITSSTCEVAERAYKKFIVYKDVLQKFAECYAGVLPKISVEEWVLNPAEAKNDISRFLIFFRNNYLQMIRNYFVNKLFLNWIPEDALLFKEHVSSVVAELFVIQLFAAIAYKERDTVSVEEYSLIISCVDRLFAHNEGVFSALKESLAALSTAELFTMLLF